MNDFVYKLPPAILPEVKCEPKDLQGYLELEVCLINFTITTNKKGINKENNKFPEEQHLSESKLNVGLLKNNKNFNQNSASVNINYKKELIKSDIQSNEDKEKNYKRIKAPAKSSEEAVEEEAKIVQVKIVWCGERIEEAASILISCKTQPQQQRQIAEFNKLKNKRKYQQYFNRPHRKQQQQQQKHKQGKNRKRQYLLLSANNKLRYRICTNSALFLAYIHSCKPIDIIVSPANSCLNANTAGNCLTQTTKALGQAKLRLPLVLLKKFNHNILKGQNFQYKTKVYTLYQEKSQLQQQQQQQNLQEEINHSLIKSGEIQLRFKMLFAPTAAASASAVAAAQHGNVVLHEKTHQLHNNHCHHAHHHHHHHHHHRHHHNLGGNNNKVSSDDVVQGDIPKRLTSQTKSEEIVEAMKKLDAKLVAYLAGETEITSKLTNCEEENKVNLNLENNNLSNNLADLLPATKFNIFKSISSIKLEMEALTLQPEGTKCMHLLQNEIEPIITVECQLSNELIKLVPRHDMFHIMQFESEKFHSLTQCTRFGQKAERAVKLDLNQELSDENANETVLDFGRIHFTVWWREPGTCLNELLGMGVLELKDLYDASLLEQCKRIEIQRRDKELARLYFKITLQREDAIKSPTASKLKRELFLPKQLSVDSDSEKSPATDKNKSKATGGQQQTSAAATATAQCNTASNANNSNIGIANDKASAQNNVKFDTTNFDDETSKVRLLKGFISANETRNLEPTFKSQTFLICRRFWLDEPATAKAEAGTGKFNYQEQFSVINDEKFLQRVDKQYLHLELWQRMSCDDGNGNSDKKAQPVGMVRMPLHQFFIAYRDAAITNHLCKGKLPVISLDAWAPIINCQTGSNVGEIKCLLAVGSDEQIKNLKETRGFLNTSSSSSCNLLDDKEFITKLQPLQIPTTSKSTASSAAKQSAVAPAANQPALSAEKMKKTTDLLDMLQKVLMTAPSSAPDRQPARAPPPGSAETKLSSVASVSPLKPTNVKLFKFSLEIQRAQGLPLNPASKAKKGYSKRNASKRFPPNEAPSCYVTFQAEEGQYPTYKSHEGMVYATNIVEKSTQPQWQQRFRLSVSIDYLKVPQKLFILKVLKKSSIDMAQGRNQPTPIEDAIIGLTALDLSAFARGLHIAGTFNIVDFNGRINGQLMVRCQPLEEIPPILYAGANIATTNANTNPAATTTAGSSVDAVIDQFEETLDLAHLNLGQAIKRKFTELEGISQRLRARLSDVTGSELPKDFDLNALDNWKPMDKEEANDDNDLEEFEHDLNTPPINDDEEEKEKEDKKKNKSKEEETQPQGKCESNKNEKNE
ncbi:uncharacterized protein ACRADG_003803 [Cochliomyia hominivorax]